MWRLTRWAFLLVLLVATATTAAATTFSSLRAAHSLNPSAKLAFSKRLAWHSTTTIHFFQNHPHILYRGPLKIRHKAWRIVAARKWTLTVAKRLHDEAVAALQPPRPPHYNEWMCIHSHEGSWTDPNAPFYGGLQMDYEFQSTYGAELLAAKGTADHWTPLEQMWVAERAYRTRGFGPWPNTARYCGLL